MEFPHCSAAQTMPGSSIQIERADSATILRLSSPDGTNRLTRDVVLALTAAVRDFIPHKKPLVIAGNEKFFSAGADLKEIAALTGPAAHEFSKIGQHLMQLLIDFPAPVYAAILGYCMGGGLDLALACHKRIASPGAVFGHRGAALGLITGWGGTQLLPRLIGKGPALGMLLAAEKITAPDALGLGLVDAVSDNPQASAMRTIETKHQD